jgi:RHS repeat-associated protein
VGVTGYTVTRGTIVTAVSGTTTSFVDATTAPSTAYAYTVTATDAAGNASSPSSGAAVTTPAATPPPDTTKPTVPTALAATAGAGSISLAWTASTDNVAVAGYTISRDGTAIATTYSTSYLDLGLAPGVAHTYTVAAFDAATNTSDPSTGASATANPQPPASVAYAYDLADRLTSITTASGVTTAFAIDALGRHASQTVGTGPASTYSYLGSSDVVVAIAAGGVTTSSAIDAVGNRVATASGGAYGYLLPDLHGNQIAAINSACTALTDAFAYDAYGNLAASVTSALPTPWRYQSRLLESAAGSPELYDFGARSYNPALGAFTSLDTKHGSAANPALLNGYLYADANPATLVDPDGHFAGDPDDERGRVRSAPVKTIATSTSAGAGPGGESTPAGTCHLAGRDTCGLDGRDLGPSIQPAPDRRSLAYNTCLANFATARSGTSPDLSQQQTLCQSQVARQFDPAPQDNGSQLAALVLLVCIELCAPAAVIAGSGVPTVAAGIAAVSSGLPDAVGAIRVLASAGAPAAALCNGNQTCYEILDRMQQSVDETAANLSAAHNGDVATGTAYGGLATVGALGLIVLGLLSNTIHGGDVDEPAQLPPPTPTPSSSARPSPRAWWPQ